MLSDLRHITNTTPTPAGRLCSKLQGFTATGNVYAYSPNNKQHAVRRIYDPTTTNLRQILWDANGNIAQITEYLYGANNQQTFLQDFRNHYWDEDDRLNLVLDNSHFSYYLYGNDGQRVAKLTGSAFTLGTGFATNAMLDNYTLYPSEYLVVTQQGYTKYYYANGTRIASRLGSGGFEKMTRLCTLDQNLTYNANTLFNSVVARVGEDMPQEYVSDPCPAYNNDMAGFRVPLQPLNFEPNFGITAQQNILQTFRQNYANEETYYFHGNHLGSANWVTTATASPTQFLLHLPYGEEFVKQLNGSYDERFTFTGKEKDIETGYYYFGARFDNVDLGFLSVDPMSDKYPSISPYAYCAWNPVKLVDIKGLDTSYYNLNGDKLFTRYGGENRNMMIVTEATQLSYDQYSNNEYYSFDVATIIFKDWDYIYSASEKQNIEFGFVIKGDGKPTSIVSGDNKHVKLPFDNTCLYDVHVHCKNTVREDGSIILNMGGEPTPSTLDKDSFKKFKGNDKFGIILGYGYIDPSSLGTTSLGSSDGNENKDRSNIIVRKQINFYNKTGAILKNDIRYDAFRRNVEKLQNTR